MAKKKVRVTTMKELSTVVTDIMGQRYRQMEKVFGNIEEPMTRAFTVASIPMTEEIKSFMAQHHRSGDTIGSFNPGIMLFDEQANMYYFKFGFDVTQGGFPALILEYGDKGSPKRAPNTAYFFMHWANKNNVDGVYGAIQTELNKMLNEIGRG